MVTSSAARSSYAAGLDTWRIDAAQFPPHGSLEERLRFLLGYAILAPSGHNAQPWLFSIQDDVIELYADRTRALAVIDPEDRELTISCGAALLNLRLALRRFGYQDVLETFPAPEIDDLLARVRVRPGGETAEREMQLFDAITKRRTNRQAFEDREVPAVLLTELQSEADDEGAWLHVVEGTSARQAVANLISGGEVILWQDRRFRRELAGWMHRTSRRRVDGVPGYARGMGDIDTLLPSSRAPHTGAGHELPTSQREVAVGTPVLAAIGTDRNHPEDWLAAGQAMERVLLRAQVHGVFASFLNQPIEVTELYPQLRHALGKSGFPQLLIRLGYGPAVQPTPRRPVSQVLFFGE